MLLWLVVSHVKSKRFVTPEGIPRSRVQDSTYVHVLWIPAIHAGMTCLFE